MAAGGVDRAFAGDRAISERKRRDGTVTFAVGAEALYTMSTGGLNMLLTYGLMWCTAAAGAAAWVLMKWLGRIRGIELASDADPPDGE
ncbi:hypothetical protein ABZ835_44815 [Streptomyces sp. NPDC047461]|uniref:hypothetical protein n=1 Tax=Streptomyces sp. NPDC047461 TaxID=3155619 RepID=UPI003406063B